MSDLLQDRILQILTADKSPLRDELLDFTLEFLLDRKLATLFDPKEAHSLIIASLTEINASNYIERYSLPQWDRYLKRCKNSQAKIGIFVPEIVQQQIDDLLKDAMLPEGKWVPKVFEPVLIRKLLSPVIQQTLVNFANKLPRPNLDPISEAASQFGSSKLGNRFAGRFSKLKQSAVFSRGKDMLSDLTADLEGRIHEIAKDFSSTAMSEGKIALQMRLESEEGRKIMSEIRRHFLSSLMETTLSELNEDIERYPVAELTRLAPAIIVESVKTSFLLDALTEELDALLKAEGDRTFREILDEAGILDESLKTIRNISAPHAKDYFQDPRFASWLGRLLASEETIPLDEVFQEPDKDQ